MGELLEQLYRLSPQQMNELLVLLQVPNQEMPPSTAIHGERVHVLIGWVQSPAVPMDDDHITISRPERTSLPYTRIRRFVTERFPGTLTLSQETGGRTPSGQQGQRQAATGTDLKTLLQTLNELVPTQLGTLILILQVPPAVMPGSSAAHGERVNALIAWAQGPGGSGLAKVQAELEKLIHPR